MKDRVNKTILAPANRIIDDTITDNTSVLVSSIVRSITGKFQRTISFTVRTDFSSDWMEQALYGILYEYNDIRSKSKLELADHDEWKDGSGLYYRLGDGTHNLKYRSWNIILVIESHAVSMSQSYGQIRTYTIITYDLSTQFVSSFEKDMYKHRKSILQLHKNSPTINVYTDLYDDGYVFWRKSQTVTKRPMSSIYLPHEQMELLKNTIDGWFSSKEEYRRHGIPWNLKILLHGPSGSGKSSIVKMVASHWNRNIYEVSGGPSGIHVPDALQSPADTLISPLFSLSDLDKCPMLINEPEIDLSKKNPEKDERLILMKQTFSKMINCLDGVNTPEGNIIVITTNHVEKFSPVLIRPGRIDLIMEIGYVTPEVFRAYVKDWYSTELPEDIKLKSNHLTIAEMQPQILFYHKSLEEFLKLYLE